LLTTGCGHVTVSSQFFSGVGGRYPWFCQEGSTLRPRHHYSWPQEATKLIKTDQGQNVAPLIGLPKLFIGGKVSATNSSPQPTVNNFAAATKMICEKLKSHPKKGGHAWPGRRICAPKRSTFINRVSLRAKCLDAKEYSRAFRPQSSLRRRTTIRFSVRPGLRARTQTE
jgi:hypothetical protein